MGSVYWQIRNGYFVFPKYLENIYSKTGRSIEQYVKSNETLLQIFLRGSLLENERPFARADADLFVLYNNPSQLNELSGLLPTYHYYDIKLIPQANICDDYVFNALLHCRSLQISGGKFDRKPIKADKQFAWEHWVRYCPADFPNIINTSDSFGLIYFKLLTRCFGVLSYLRYKKFTRDISECINIAQKEYPEGAEILSELRQCLENRNNEVFNIRKN
jgi:hypothetical protein